MQLVNVNDVYALFQNNGTAKLHVADIDLIPRVDAVEVVHGRWEWRGGIPWCSNCGEMPPGYSYDGVVNTTPYCPLCGAKMDLEEF